MLTLTIIFGALALVFFVAMLKCKKNCKPCPPCEECEPCEEKDK